MKFLLKIIASLVAVCVLGFIGFILWLHIPVSVGDDVDSTKNDYAIDGFKLNQNSKGEILLPHKTLHSLAIIMDSLTIENGHYVLKMNLSQATDLGIDSAYYMERCQYFTEMNRMNDSIIAQGDSVGYWNLASYRKLLHRADKEGVFAQEEESSDSNLILKIFAE